MNEEEYKEIRLEILLSKFIKDDANVDYYSSGKFFSEQYYSFLINSDIIPIELIKLFECLTDTARLYGVMRRSEFENKYGQIISENLFWRVNSKDITIDWEKSINHTITELSRLI